MPSATSPDTSAGNPGGSYSSAMFAAPATADLHLAAGGNALVNGAATPIPGLTTDYDGDTRSATSPVMALATQRCAVSRSIIACESNQRPW